MISDNSVCVMNDGSGMKKDAFSRRLTNPFMNSAVAASLSYTVHIVPELVTHKLLVYTPK